MRSSLSALLDGRASTHIPNQFKEEFDHEFNRINLQSTRVISGLAVLLVPASAILDYFIHPEHLIHFVIVRALMSVVPLIIYILSYIKPLQKLSTLLTMVSMIWVGTGLVYMIRVLGYGDPYYAGLNLVYLVLIVTPWGAKETLFTSAVIYCAYLVPILLFDFTSLDVSVFVNNNVFQIETIIIACVINHFQAIRRQNEIVNRLTIAHQAKELEEIDRFKREFIANVTHELKTPLAIVMGNADLIVEETDDPRLREGIDLIRKATFQLANHVDRIIAVSNVDDPDARPDLGNYDYVGIVQNIFDLFESRARTENITYALNMAEGPLVVNIDAVKIEEVLNNLIQNAFKFTPSHGIITITVSTDGNTVYTEVSDSGVGIPEDKISRIFDRMYQADEVLSKRHSGIGLGLYICRKNVELLGGQITAHSKQGKGTSFKFSLPLHIDQDAEVQNRPYTGAERRRAMDRRSGLDRRSSARLRRFEYQQRMGLDELAQMTYADNVRDYESQNPALPTILVIEDNAGMMKVIVEALREEYNLLIAFDAFEAQRKLDGARTPISLILSDIMMPGMNGYDFLEKTMAQEQFQHIPFIFITALMSQEDQLKGFALGATDYIVKPYNIKILKEKVDHWISRRQYEVLLKNASSSLEERVLQLSRAKDIILHEIGNPLQMITGASYFVEKLRSASLERASAEEKVLWKSVQSLDYGLKAIRSVLESSRQIDMEKLSIRDSETIPNLVNKALVQTRHLLGDIQIHSEVDRHSPLRVACDRTMLVQVLVNLIRNGVEAIREIDPPDGGVLRITSERPDENLISIKIEDNGIGMDPEILENLFRFKYTSKKDGTGIGLNLSRIILKLHNGGIEAESRKGVGSTFSLTLPVESEPSSP